MADTGYNRDAEIRNIARELSRMNNLKELELELEHFGMTKDNFEEKLRLCKETYY